MYLLQKNGGFPLLLVSLQEGIIPNNNDQVKNYSFCLQPVPFTSEKMGLSLWHPEVFWP